MFSPYRTSGVVLSNFQTIRKKCEIASKIGETCAAR